MLTIAVLELTYFSLLCRLTPPVSYSDQTGNLSTLLASECPYILKWTLFPLKPKKGSGYASRVRNTLPENLSSSLYTSLQTALPLFTCSLSQHPDFCFPPHIPSLGHLTPINSFRRLTKSGTLSFLLSSRLIICPYCFNISKCIFHEHLKQFYSNTHNFSFQDPLLLPVHSANDITITLRHSA